MPRDDPTARNFRQRKWPRSFAIEKELGILEGAKDSFAQGFLRRATVRTKRKQAKPDHQAEVLARCLRRCCVCFALNQNDSEKRGQIAHLDRDPSNDDPDNLVFLCLSHHDQYDSKTSQSKNLTEAEVRQYRERLWNSIDGGLLANEPPAKIIRLRDIAPVGPTQQVIGDRNKVTQNVINIRTSKATRSPILPGTVGEEPKRIGYLRYLADRWNEFKEWECKTQGQALRHGFIHQAYKRQMKYSMLSTPRELFTKGAEYLQKRIKDTKLGRKKRDQKLFDSFEEFVRSK